jgi:hypothetical protein
MMTRLTFEELRAFLASTDKGKIVDSLIAVELGLQDYTTLWEAHCDLQETLPHPDSPDSFVVSFLIEMAEYLDFHEVDFDKILGAGVD